MLAKELDRGRLKDLCCYFLSCIYKNTIAGSYSTYVVEYEYRIILWY